MKIKCKSKNYCKSCCYIKNTYIDCEIHSKQNICKCGSIERNIKFNVTSSNAF